jgi:hypothetical protein
LRNQVVSSLVWLWWVIDLVRFEFESGTVRLLITISSCLLLRFLSWLGFLAHAHQVFNELLVRQSKLCRPVIWVWMLAGGSRLCFWAAGSNARVFLILLVLHSWFHCHTYEVFDEMCVGQFVWFWLSEFHSWLFVHRVLSSAVISGCLARFLMADSFSITKRSWPS